MISGKLEKFYAILNYANIYFFKCTCHLSPRSSSFYCIRHEIAYREQTRHIVTKLCLLLIFSFMQF